ncbi:MAG TPA: hypothetical protein DD437_10500 [Rhodobiaceae bacterium]|nr:hypothetical protein [Rhodobiaceae bacterium]
MSWIETRLERLRSDYEDAIDAEDVNRQQAKRVELDQFETAQHRLMLLNAAGRDGQVDSLSSILSELPETNIDNLDSKTEWYEFAWIVRQSTNQILIFSMVACGIMGAIFSGVWRARQNAKGPNIEGNANWDWPASAIAKDTVVGAGAGLTVFLILSGGSVLFVFSSSPELLLNPYSGSLFAMLAGLFSEKAYGALAKRLDAAIQ